MGDGDDGGDELSRSRAALDLEHGWVPLGALIVAVCLPILLAVLDAARAKWVPTADAATIVTRSYDMWSAHRPLVGQYSLAGGEGAKQVFSPGPFLYLVLAPAARFGPAWSLPLTMGLLASACFGIALHAARRIGGWWFAVIVAVGLVGTVRASGAGTYVEVWNPWAGLAPFAALVLVCWLVALGRRWWLVTAVVLASFLIQTHLTYLPPSLVLLAVAVIGGWWPGSSGADDTELDPSDAEARSRWPDDPSVRRGERLLPAWSAFVAGLVCWALPLYEQFTNSPGNLELVRDAASAKDDTFGPAVAVNVWWRASGLYPAFSRAAGSQISELNELRVDAGPAAYIGTAVLALALLAVGWFAIRRRSREVLVGALIGLGLTVAAIATCSRLPLDRLIVAPYSLRWIVMAGLVPWLVIALAVIRFDVLPTRVPSARVRTGAAVGAIVVVALFAGTVSRTDDAAWMIDPARNAGEDLVAATRPGDRIRLSESGRYEVVLTPALAWSLRESGRMPVMIRNFRVGTGSVYGPEGVRCDGMVVIRSADEPAPEGGRRITRTAYDQPDAEQEIAVYLVDDESAHGRC